MKRIKELWHQFDGRAAQAIRSNSSKKRLQRLGVLILGLCVLLGISQANSIQKLLRGSAQSIAGIQSQRAAQTAVPMTPAPNERAVTSSSAEPDPVSSAPNIVDLVGESEYIIRGFVADVTDGFENGIPYTQVTVQVKEAFRGEIGQEYSFRQFGLLKPRKMENGKVNLNVTPEGWAKYTVGEDALLFLFKRASMTGLQTTVGLGQGKVVFQGGNATSQFLNEGLFENVHVDAKLLNDKDKRLLATKKGAVNADGFVSFVRRAVKNKWIEGGKMRHAKK
jgi:hypothetical protein